MTEEQVIATQKNMCIWASGMLGTKDNPTHVALFLEGYIQLQKETVAAQGDEASWRREKSILDGILGLAAAIRMYEDTYKQSKEKE